MKRILVLLAALMMTAGLATADEKQTLRGSFVWEQRGSAGDLEAIFTPTGENRWDVSFHFEFRGKPHTYTGTAEGSLSDGPLTGEVQNENRKRTWRFKGTFDGGEFNGTHTEVEGDREEDTGTLTLSVG